MAALWWETEKIESRDEVLRQSVNMNKKKKNNKRAFWPEVRGRGWHYFTLETIHIQNCN